ncbi:MAG: KEOPS complex subunit Pcc1 [Candidatus Methanomethylophilaceae archaeon]|jgi:KEOPS complex subunit Pcc1|nr:KEOPS complex subunit Pcc1 [Candidatus Methanomethylophilaceae archaeon]NLF34103.1 hypothetical protein [Thermoplasmatales archaeon]
MLRALVSIESDSSDAIVSAIGPEAGRELPRTQVSVGGSDGRVTLDIRASDSSAMRAALNSYLECIRITEEIEKITR